MPTQTFFGTNIIPAVGDMDHGKPAQGGVMSDFTPSYTLLLDAPPVYPSAARAIRAIMRSIRAIAYSCGQRCQIVFSFWPFLFPLKSQRSCEPFHTSNKPDRSDRSFSRSSTDQIDHSLDLLYHLVRNLLSADPNPGTMS